MSIIYESNIGIYKTPAYELDVNGIINANEIYENGKKFFDNYNISYRQNYTTEYGLFFWYKFDDDF